MNYIDRWPCQCHRDQKNQSRNEKRTKNHHVGTVIIDLRFVEADNDTVMPGDGRSLFSFSSDAEPDVDLSTSDDAVVASFA